MLTLLKIMQKLLSQYSIGFIFLLLLVPGSVSAESARALVASGNEAFSREDFAAALENYEKAAESEPGSAAVHFNKGDALYKQEKYDEALNVFEQAAAEARKEKDQMLEAQTRYNMGNSAYRRAEALGRENPERALEEYKRSSEYYQSAVKLDPSLSEAAFNLEASRIAAKQIEELIRQKQEQAQQQAQQKQEIAEELQNLQQQQKEAAEESRDLARSREQQGVDGAGAQKAEQLADKQKSITGRTGEMDEKLERLSRPQNSELPDKMARDHVKKAIEKQVEAEKKLQQNQPYGAHENQQEAARELQEALQQLKKDQEGSQEKESAGREEKGEKEQAGEQQSQLQHTAVVTTSST